MVAAALDGDWATARALNRRYFRLITANFWESSPGPVKCVMAMMGRLEGKLSLTHGACDCGDPGKAESAG